MEILTKRKLIEKTHYLLDYSDSEGAGYAFDCDKYGNPLPFDNEIIKANYYKCLNGEMEGVEFCGIDEVVSSYTENAIGKCSCGNVMELENEYFGACECKKCGQWYGVTNGERFHRPDQWQEVIDPEDYY